jgi:hypothetical protein
MSALIIRRVAAGWDAMTYESLCQTSSEWLRVVPSLKGLGSFYPFLPSADALGYDCVALRARVSMAFTADAQAAIMGMR